MASTALARRCVDGGHLGGVDLPALVPSLGPGEALTVANSASSQLTLTVMLIIAAIGVPLVLFYFFLIYRTYAGRIDMTQGTDGHY